MFDPDSISQEKLHLFRDAAERAWDEDTRHQDFQEHPQPSAGQCFVTASWLRDKLGGHVAVKNGHYFWASPDKNYIIDLTGDQCAYPPSEAQGVPLDHRQWRPGPPIYTRADHPLYRDFRVKEYPEHPRAKIFSHRANMALEHKLPRRHAGPMGSEPYSGETPQKQEDFADRYFHDTLSDLQLSLEEPPNNEYRWFHGNGQLHVSPFHSHDELRDHSGVPANHSGPIAAGFVHVKGGDALWSAESNLGYRGLVKELEDYGKTVGWKWGGLVGGDGQPVHDDFGAKKSYWYRWEDEVQISERPFWGATGKIDIRGKTASVRREANQVMQGLSEWADDFGLRLAEVPGGSDMTDKIKNKEWPMQYDRGNPEKEVEPAFDGEPQGEITCPVCGEISPDFKAFVLHREQHKPQDAEEIADGHFPTVEDKDAILPLRQRNTAPTAMPIASFREAAVVPDFDLYSSLWGYAKDDYIFYGGYLGGQMVGYGVVQPEGDQATVIMVHSAVPHRKVGSTILSKIMLHYPNLRSGAASPEGEALMSKLGWLETEPGLWRYAAGGTEMKDMLQAGLPFVYDIDKDTITVGHPGQKTSDVQGQFTPGGIVEGYYEPGGKVIINTTTTMPYSTYHLMQLWYWTHPALQVTSLELETGKGKPKKLAAQSIGQYIKTLTVADPAAWKAYQALKGAGGQVYVVGGAVRDALLQKEPKDIDLMVSGLPGETVNHVLEQLPGWVELQGQKFGVYRYHTKGSEVEVALPRTDNYEGERRGQGRIDVDHEMPVEQDLLRRDFTGNSMAVDLDSGQLLDPYGGAQDIENRTLRTTHPESFNEDPTRLIRALVAYSRHGLVPDEQTRYEMAQTAWRLDQESPDVLKQQLDKLLVSPNPAAAIRLAHETGVLAHLFPELEHNWNFDQQNKHHHLPLGEHCLQVLDLVSQKSADPDLRLAALLHDVGKPASAWADPETGEMHFYQGEINGVPVGADHAVVGANLADQRLRGSFNYPVKNLKNVNYLIENHMFPAFSSQKGARKFLNKHGEYGDDLLTLRDADMNGKGMGSKEIAQRTSVEQMRQYLEAVRAQGHAVDQTGLAINGNDLLGLGLRPGPQVGQVLRNLVNDIVEDPSLNERDKLLERAQEYINALPSSS